MTKVVNIYTHVVPEFGRTLIELSPRTWPDEYVYVGRPGRGQAGTWGNPVEIGKPCVRCGKAHSREHTVRCYWKILLERVKSDPVFAASVAALSGKTLVCFCKPKRCHGDVLAHFADVLAGGGMPGNDFDLPAAA